MLSVLPKMPSQDAEKIHQRRSRIAQSLNVPKRTPRLFTRCGLVEHPDVCRVVRPSVIFQPELMP